MTKPIAVLVAVASLAVAVPSVASAATVTAHDRLETPILRELNRIRAAHGLRALSASRPLARAADAHAASMGTLGYFSHTSANGTSFDRRIVRFYPMLPSRSWTVGENLLWSSGELTAARAVALWLASPGHRRNILSPAWREIGISAVSAKAAGGTFEGRDVTLVVTDFGARS